MARLQHNLGRLEAQLKALPAATAAGASRRMELQQQRGLGAQRMRQEQGQKPHRVRRRAAPAACPPAPNSSGLEAPGLWREPTLRQPSLGGSPTALAVAAIAAAREAGFTLPELLPPPQQGLAGQSPPATPRLPAFTGSPDASRQHDQWSGLLPSLGPASGNGRHPWRRHTEQHFAPQQRQQQQQQTPPQALLPPLSAGAGGRSPALERLKLAQLHSPLPARRRTTNTGGGDDRAWRHVRADPGLAAPASTLRAGWQAGDRGTVRGSPLDESVHALVTAGVSRLDPESSSRAASVAPGALSALKMLRRATMNDRLSAADYQPVAAADSSD